MSNERTLTILSLTVSRLTTSSTNPIINEEVGLELRPSETLKRTLSKKEKQKKTRYDTILSSLAQSNVSNEYTKQDLKANLKHLSYLMIQINEIVT